MRGKETGQQRTKKKVGITPAHAGKSPLQHPAVTGCWDHPRACGEKQTCRCRNDRKPGSPPRMRGKVLSNTNFTSSSRITPAHAGKRCSVFSFKFYFWDHPRACGEKKGVERMVSRRKGSPPRMRGKVCGHGQGTLPLGITPAHAGKRLKRSRSTVPHAAIVPLFPSVCNKPAGSDGSPAGHDAPPFLPLENAAPASPAYNLRSL